MSPRPLVSVVIDTYNHERYIETAIQSVLDQELAESDKEVIVVDDGSTDRSPDLVRRFGTRVRYLRKPNGGQASAFNEGIRVARGAVVAFLDGDDWWSTGKLTAVLGALESNPDVGIVGHGFFYADDQGRLSQVIVPRSESRIHLCVPGGGIRFSQLKAFFGTSRLTVRREVLQRVLPVPQELWIEADEFIFTSALAITDGLVIDRPLVHYRLHGGNLFHFDGPDLVRLQRKSKVLTALVRALPPRLAELGVGPSVIWEVMAPLRVDATRLELALYGGKRRQTVKVERAAMSLMDDRLGLGYRIFKALVLSLAAVSPPRTFYRLRRSYARAGFAKVRYFLGARTRPVSVIECRRLVAGRKSANG